MAEERHRTGGTDKMESGSCAASCCALVPDDWTPTSENINALPEPLRRYIMHLETNCDPAGNVAEIACLRENQKALEAIISHNSRNQESAGSPD